MKKLKYIFLVMGLLFGCSDYLDVNTDPNNPSDADIKFVLPAGQQSVASRMGGYYRITGSIWGQHYTQNNTASQYIPIDNYDINNLNFLEPDFLEMFSGALSDLQFVRTRAAEAENWNMYLIAVTMQAYGYQVIADLYDGAPVSEGLQGDLNFTPVWNSGEEVYDLLLADLDDALSKDFTAATNISPEENDLLFDGDVDSWIRFANTLKLKLMMRFALVNPSKAQSLITGLMSSGAEFLQTDAAISRYYDEPGRGNPLYETDRRNLNTDSNLKASLTLVTFLQDNSDPRLAEFYDEPVSGGPITGMAQGSSSTPSTVLDSKTISGAKVEPGDAVYLISLPEAYFLRAEAAARGFTSEDAKAMYDAGVLAAFDRYNLDGQSFVDPAGAYEYDGNVETIIMQKWISQVGGNSLEAWFDKLRTGIPAFPSLGEDAVDDSYEIFTFPQDAVTTEIPRRLLIPEDEVLNNANAPEQPADEIFAPVWWDTTN